MDVNNVYSHWSWFPLTASLLRRGPSSSRWSNHACQNNLSENIIGFNFFLIKPAQQLLLNLKLNCLWSNLACSNHCQTVNPLSHSSVCLPLSFTFASFLCFSLCCLPFLAHNLFSAETLDCDASKRKPMLPWRQTPAWLSKASVLENLTNASHQECTARLNPCPLCQPMHCNVSTFSFVEKKKALLGS